ncbi:MAG: hypothetical protein V8Q32_07865 [Anaerotignum faecicola]
MEEAKTATVLYGAYILIFDLKNNTILKKREALPVWGKMEVKDGRVFVPLRNWSGILQSIGYLIEEGDITWDSTTKLATVRAVEQKLDPSNGLEKPTLSGKGAQASYAVSHSPRSMMKSNPLEMAISLHRNIRGKRMSACGRHGRTQKMYGIFWIVRERCCRPMTPERITIWRTAVSRTF